MKKLNLSTAWQAYVEETAFNGIRLIYNFRTNLLARCFWIAVTITAVILCGYQCFESIDKYISHPSVVATKFNYGQMKFPAVTFCSANPFISGRINATTAPKIKDLMDSLKGIPKDNNNTITRSKRQIEGCPSGYDEVGKFCYFKSNLTGSFQNATSFCASNNATLPMFDHLDDYLNFKTWWNAASTSEVWLGLMYNNVTVKRWAWLNKCPYSYFPGFWVDRWDYYNMLSIFRIVAMYIPTLNGGGVTTVDPTTSTVNVVCSTLKYDQKPTSCFSFSQSNATGLFCNQGEWFCITDHPEYQYAYSAWDADSCFCFNSHFENFTTAMDSCAQMGGFLSDIRTEEEKQVLTSLLRIFLTNQSTNLGFCPHGFTYFNESCFIFSSTLQNTLAKIEYACYNNFSQSHIVSIHSIYELWISYYLMMIDPSKSTWNYADYGCHLGGYKVYTRNYFAWFDNSTFDYQPPWTKWPWVQPDNEANIYIATDSGFTHDYLDDFDLPFVCRKTASRYPLWVNMMSTDSNLTDIHCANSTSDTSFPFYVRLFYPRVYNAVNSSNANQFASVCRKDRNPNPVFKFCSSNISTTTSAPTVISTTIMEQTSMPKTSTDTSTPITTEDTTLEVPSTETTTWSITTVPITTSTMKYVQQTTPSLQPTSSISSTSPSNSQVATSLDIFWNGYSSDKVAAITQAQVELLYLAYELDPEILSAMSYSLEDLLMFCSFNGTICDKRNILKNFYSNIGNCYSYNLNAAEPSLQRQAGANFVNASWYLPTSLSPGFLLLVHQQNEEIFPDSEAIKLVVGYQAEIALSAKQIIRRPEPYSDCINVNATAKYSFEGCIRKCHQQKIIETCGCGDPSLPMVDENHKFCSWEKRNCSENVLNLLNNGTKESCNCPQACRTQNETNIHIYFKDLFMIIYEQQPNYDFNRLTSDLANWICLLLGCAVVTYFEIVAFIISIF